MMEYPSLIEEVNLIVDDGEREIVRRVLRDLRQARENWPPFNSAHEGYGVLLEEVDELWDHVKTKQKNRNIEEMCGEAEDVAAMGLRFAIEVCNETVGRK